MNWAAAHPPYDVILSVSEGPLNVLRLHEPLPRAKSFSVPRSFDAASGLAQDDTGVGRIEAFPFFHSLRLTAWERKRIIISSNPARSVRS